MKLVTYDERPRDRLLAHGHEITGGESVEMNDADAALLEADPHVRVTVKPVASPRSTTTRGANPSDDDKE